MAISDSLRYQQRIIISGAGTLAVISAGLFLFFLIQIIASLMSGAPVNPAKKEDPNTAEARRIMRLVRPPQPTRIVENINETQTTPTKPKYLSDLNSEAKSDRTSPNPTEDVVAKPGDFTNLESKKGGQTAQDQAKKLPEFMRSTNLSESVFGKSVDKDKKKVEADDAAGDQGKSFQTTMTSRNRTGSTSRFDSQFSLSTKAWNWAPYIREIRSRLQKYLTPPAAFYQGLMRGRSVVMVKIDLNGELIDFQVIDHYGHSKLKQTTIDGVKAIFQLPPLPPDFPDKNLTLRGIISY